jgi:hypothetical protein
MRRCTALFVAALALAVPPRAIAKGGYVRVPEPKVVRAGPPIPDLRLSPGQIFGGCGAKRTRDPVTHKCRGPADIGN